MFVFKHHSIIKLIDEWANWESKVQSFMYPKDHIPDYCTLLVPNVDNVKMEYLIDLIAKQNKVEINDYY